MKLRPTVWGTAMAGLGVAFGAFGAHFLKDRLEPEELEVFKTAVHYQMIHGIALIITGILLKSKPSKNLGNAAISFIMGVFLFSGSLYILTIGKFTHVDMKWVGAITPIGGVSFILGWGLMLYHHISKR